MHVRDASHCVVPPSDHAGRVTCAYCFEHPTSCLLHPTFVSFLLPCILAKKASLPSFCTYDPHMPLLLLSSSLSTLRPLAQNTRAELRKLGGSLKTMMDSIEELREENKENHESTQGLVIEAAGQVVGAVNDTGDRLATQAASYAEQGQQSFLALGEIVNNYSKGRQVSAQAGWSTNPMSCVLKIPPEMFVINSIITNKAKSSWIVG